MSIIAGFKALRGLGFGVTLIVHPKRSRAVVLLGDNNCIIVFIKNSLYIKVVVHFRHPAHVVRAELV